MDTLKVGQRIELFRVLNCGGYHTGCFTPGTIRPGVLLNHMGADVETNLPSIYKQLMMFVGSEVKPVGCMVVKKLKQ